MKFFRFHKGFFIIMIVLFLIEVLIALYVRDQFIRPFLGDVIVIWFIYYFFRAFVNTKPIYIAIFTLLFAFVIEMGQYFKLVEILRLQEYKWARIVIGTSFSWWDMLCYFVGFLLLFLFDKELRNG